MPKRKNFSLLAKINEITEKEAELLQIPIGTRLGTNDRYEIVDLIGIGSISAVYLAKDYGQEEQLVALKLILPSILADEKVLASFVDKITTLQEFHHPNVVEFLEFWQQNSLYFYTLEYVQGMSLGDWLQQQNKAIPIPIVKKIIYELSSGVANIHNICGHYLLHPENILIKLDPDDQKPQIKITDYAIYCLRNVAFWQKAAELFQIEAYRAPELRQYPCQLSKEADLYSIGVILHQLLHQKLPSNKFPSRSDTPSLLQSVLEQWLEKNFQKRPPLRKILPMLENMAQSNTSRSRGNESMSIGATKAMPQMSRDMLDPKATRFMPQMRREDIEKNTTKAMPQMRRDDNDMPPTISKLDPVAEEKTVSSTIETLPSTIDQNNLSPQNRSPSDKRATKFLPMMTREQKDKHVTKTMPMMSRDQITQNSNDTPKQAEQSNIEENISQLQETHSGNISTQPNHCAEENFIIPNNVQGSQEISDISEVSSSTELEKICSTSNINSADLNQEIPNMFDMQATLSDNAQNNSNLTADGQTALSDNAQNNTNPTADVQTDLSDNAQNNTNPTADVQTALSDNAQNNSNLTADVQTALSDNAQNNSNLTADGQTDLSNSSQNNSNLTADVQTALSSSAQNNSNLTADVQADLSSSAQNNSNLTADVQIPNSQNHATEQSEYEESPEEIEALQKEYELLAQTEPEYATKLQECQDKLDEQQYRQAIPWLEELLAFKETQVAFKLLQTAKSQLALARKLKNQAQQCNEPQEALHLLQQSLEIYPYDPEVLHSCEFMRGVAEKLMSIDEKCSEILTKGDQLAEQGQYEKAILAWQSMLGFTNHEQEFQDRIMQATDILAEQAQTMLDQDKPFEAQQAIQRVLLHSQDAYHQELAKQIEKVILEKLQQFQTAYEQGLHLIEQKRFLAAILIWENVLSCTKDPSTLKQQIKQAREMQNTLEQNEQEYLQILSTARNFEKKENYDSALEAYQQIIQKRSQWLCPVSDPMPELDRIQKLRAGQEYANKEQHIFSQIQSALDKGKLSVAKQLFTNALFSMLLPPSLEEKKSRLLQLWEQKKLSRKKLIFILQISGIIFLLILSVVIFCLLN